MSQLWLQVFCLNSTVRAVDINYVWFGSKWLILEMWSAVYVIFVIAVYTTTTHSSATCTLVAMRILYIYTSIYSYMYIYPVSFLITYCWCSNLCNLLFE